MSLIKAHGASEDGERWFVTCDRAITRSNACTKAMGEFRSQEEAHRAALDAGWLEMAGKYTCFECLDVMEESP